MGEVFAAFQRFFAEFYGFREAGFLVEVSADGFLGKRAGSAVLFDRQLGETVLPIGREANFHALRVGVGASSVKRWPWAGRLPRTSGG